MNPRVEKILKLPAYQRVLILCAMLLMIVGGFIYLVYLPKHGEYSSLQERNSSLQVKLQEDQRIADNLPKFKDEYEKMKQQMERALTELPNKKEIPTLLTNIASLAKDHGLDVLRFKPGKENPKGFYAEVPVELKLDGSYHEVAMFCDSVGKLPRIVNISNLTMGSAKTAKGHTHLSVDCLATTFRFLEESSAQQAKRKKK
jgi:type IV pilus assembly protein PilO